MQEEITSWIQDGVLLAFFAAVMTAVWKGSKYIGLQLFRDRSSEKPGAVWQFIDYTQRYVETNERFTSGLEKRDVARDVRDERQMDLCHRHQELLAEQTEQLAVQAKQLTSQEKVEASSMEALETLTKILTDSGRLTHSRSDAAAVDFAMIWESLVNDPGISELLLTNTLEEIKRSARRIVRRVQKAKGDSDSASGIITKDQLEKNIE